MCPSFADVGQTRSGPVVTMGRDIVAPSGMQRILIVGMGRSGTTFITEFLGKCGVFLDRVNWAQEHEGARKINDAILAKKCGARRGLPYGTLPEGEIELEEKWHRKAQCFISEVESRTYVYGHR